MKNTDPCPCDTGLSYGACCGRWHTGTQAATDATALMRSRYSAWALRLGDYLLATWHPSTRPETLDMPESGVRWLGLEVRAHHATGTDTATVEFVARSKLGGRAHRLHEVSDFVREEGRWYYVRGL